MPMPRATAMIEGKASAPRKSYPRRKTGTTRQRTGCMTCRNRKKKCDGRYPVCENCARLNFSCVLEKPRAPILPQSSTWKNKPRSIDETPAALAGNSQSSISGFSLPEPTICWLNHNPDGNDVSSSRSMIRYYVQTFSLLLTTNLENNCFLSVFLPLSIESPTLLKALVAWSSSHLSLRNGSFSNLALELRGDSFRALSIALASPQRALDYEVAACLVLCSMEIILGDTSQWYEHLAGAHKLIRLHLDSSTCQSQSSVPPDLLKSFEGQWILRNFAYHDIMMSVTMDRKPFICGYYWRHEDNTGTESVADSYFGYASRLIYLISEISVLSFDMIKRPSGDDSQIGMESCQHSVTEDEAAIGSTDMPRANFSERAFFLENELRTWSCVVSTNASLQNQAEAYRSAALIYLYRTIRRRLPHLASMVEPKIIQALQGVIKCLESMPQGCLPECTLLFPMFIAGGEAKDVEHIRMIRQRMLDVISSRRFQNVQVALTVLDEMWRLRVARKDIRVDWRDVLESRGWKLALT